MYKSVKFDHAVYMGKGSSSSSSFIGLIKLSSCLSSRFLADCLMNQMTIFTTTTISKLSISKNDIHDATCST